MPEPSHQLQMKAALTLLSLASETQNPHGLCPESNPSPNTSAYKVFITEWILWGISGKCLVCLLRTSLSGLAEPHNEHFPVLGQGMAAGPCQVPLPAGCLMLQIRSCRFSALKMPNGFPLLTG